jgi:hypothetical protein
MSSQNQRNIAAEQVVTGDLATARMQGNVRAAVTAGSGDMTIASVNAGGTTTAARVSIKQLAGNGTTSGLVLEPDGSTNAAAIYRAGSAAGDQLVLRNQATDTLYVANGNVGIGQGADTWRLRIANSSTFQFLAVYTGTSGTTAGAGLQNGITATPSNGHRLGFLTFGGEITGSTIVNSVALSAYATQNWSAGNKGAALAIEITPNGSTTRSERVRFDQNGNVGIGQTSPTAVLHIKAGTAAASTAPIKLTAGTLNTTPEAGAIEFDGTNLYFTDSGGTRRQIAVV